MCKKSNIFEINVVIEKASIYYLYRNTVQMLRVFNFEKLQPYTLKRYFTTTLENDGGVNATETMTFIYQSIRRARAM